MRIEACFQLSSKPQECAFNSFHCQIDSRKLRDVPCAQTLVVVEAKYIVIASVLRTIHTHYDKVIDLHKEYLMFHIRAYIMRGFRAGYLFQTARGLASTAFVAVCIPDIIKH